MGVRVRPACDDDAEAMSGVLESIKADTGRERPSDVDFVRGRYLDAPERIRCSVAVDEAAGEILGFQSLKRATAGNPYGVEEGWGIIGTHVSPLAARRGVGRALFEVTRAAAKEAGLEKIDATIGADNPEGLAYYEAMGFVTYREDSEPRDPVAAGTVNKMLSL